MVQAFKPHTEVRDLSKEQLRVYDVPSFRKIRIEYPKTLKDTYKGHLIIDSLGNETFIPQKILEQSVILITYKPELS